MRKLIYTRKAELLDWAARVIGCPFEASSHAIGFETDGRLRAVSVFDHFSDGDCAVHVASDGSRHWLARHFLMATFAYPFLDRQQPRATSLIPASNKASLSFCQKIGFSVEGKMRQAAGTDDLIVLGMLRDECRWLRPEFLRRVKEIHGHG